MLVQGRNNMRWHQLLLLTIFMIIIGSPAASASYTLSTDKSTYQVGESITVYLCTDGGKVGLTASGPYTMNFNLGDLPQGCYNFQLGQAEQQDVGYWNLVMTMDTPVPFFPALNPPQTHFTVMASNVPEFSIPVLVLVIVLVGSLIMTKLGTGRRRFRTL
jgi:hypothetical protein